MQPQKNICPRCASDLHKMPPNENAPCPWCGYPLELGKMLERIRSERLEITETITFQAIGSDLIPEAIDYEEVMRIFDEYIDRLFPERENKEIIVISIENDHFVFNFGPHNAWKKYYSLI